MINQFEQLSNEKILEVFHRDEHGSTSGQIARMASYIMQIDMIGVSPDNGVVELCSPSEPYYRVTFIKARDLCGSVYVVNKSPGSVISIMNMIRCDDLFEWQIKPPWPQDRILKLTHHTTLYKAVEWAIDGYHRGATISYAIVRQRGQRYDFD
jgi:hypothetical protein